MRSRAAARRRPDGSVLRWYGTTEDVHDRKATEAALRDALDARGLLMREADHRIKNSLMMVAGVLQMQRGRVADPAAAAALDGARAHVMGCCRSGGHLVKVFTRSETQGWDGEYSAASSSSRR